MRHDTVLVTPVLVVSSVIVSLSLVISSAVNILTFAVFHRIPVDVDGGVRLSRRIRRTHLLTTKGEPIEAVRVTSRYASTACVMYSHGNAEHTHNRRYLDYICSLSDAMGCDVVTYDYVGYGKSSWRYVSTQKRCMRSIQAVYAHVASHYPQILLMGWSLGSAPTLRLSLEQLSRPGTSPTPIKGVVLLSPLLSAIRTRFDGLGRALRPFDLFDNDSQLRLHPRLQHVNVPYLILHGTDDQVIPMDHSVKLHSLLIHKTSNVACHFLDRVGHAIPIGRIVEYTLPMVHKLREKKKILLSKHT